MSNIELADQEIREVLKKYNVEIDYVLRFPDDPVIPEELQLALIIIKNHKMKISFALKSKE